MYLFVQVLAAAFEEYDEKYAKKAKATEETAEQVDQHDNIQDDPIDDTTTNNDLTPPISQEYLMQGDPKQVGIYLYINANALHVFDLS